MERSILYFDDVGKQNTDDVVKVAAVRAEELGIEYIVLSSTEGHTALKMAEAVKGKNVKVIAISHQYGLREDGKWEMDEDNLRNFRKWE